MFLLHLFESQSQLNFLLNKFFRETPKFQQQLSILQLQHVMIDEFENSQIMSSYLASMKLQLGKLVN